MPASALFLLGLLSASKWPMGVVWSLCKENGKNCLSTERESPKIKNVMAEEWDGVRVKEQFLVLGTVKSYPSGLFIYGYFRTAN